MALDVEVPDPPELTNRGVPSAFDGVELAGSEADLRREDLEDALRDGAWQEGFREWAEYTDLPDDQYRMLSDAGVFEAFDFYWDPEERELAFEPPPVPDDLRDGPDGSDGETIDRDTVRRELRDLGETVLEALQDADLDFGEEADDEFTWGDETFGESSDTQE